MDGRVGSLKAKRSLSAFVVVSVVMSAFAGFMFMSDSEPGVAQAIGDLIVTGDTYGTYIIEGIEQPVDGNVEVSDGGVLIIRDGTLSVISNIGLIHGVDVGAGGTIMLDHGTLTTYLNQIDPWPFMDVVVHDGGRIVMDNVSYLSFPGSLVLSNGAELEMHESTVGAISGDLVSLYVLGSSGAVAYDAADDGPVMTVTDSTISMYDSSISALPEYATLAMPASNLTLTGSSTLLAVNSYIGVDFGPALTAAQWYTHNVLVVNDLSHAYFYGTSFEEYTGVLADRSPAIVASGTASSPAIPLTKGAADNTGGSLAYLASLDALTYEVGVGETMEIETWDVGALVDGLTVSSAAILVTYTASSDYDGTNAVQWAPEGSAYMSTGIIPSASDPPLYDGLYSLPLASVPTVGDIRNLDLRFINNDANTGTVSFDRAWVLFTIGGNAYIYRWLQATIGDEYGVPIPGATVSAQFTGATEFKGQTALYYTPDGILTTPQTEVLEYLGETSESYLVTKSDGRALVPYITDLILDSGSMFSLFVGSYAITGTAIIGADTHSSSESFSFPAYPAMGAADQSFEFTVELLGVVADSPDPSRWLVVTHDELVIEDMTYYHAGDVIVAGDGTLLFNNAVFQLVQDADNQRTIYVDGEANLIFNNTLVESEMAINIIVQGTGTLQVLDSELTGVSIVALEDAHVILDGSTMDGTITTSWDSTAVIEVYDSDLAQSPVLSGHSFGGFTNTTVPSIIVEDDAIAYIYRWIHVTVFDGAGSPLPMTIVSTRYFINDTYSGSSTTGTDGVAWMNALGTVLTSSGSTFVGNYKVNATYWYDGTPYYASREAAIGVMPYTEPLGANATFTSLTVPEALPNLSIDLTGAVTTDPVMPRKGEITTITAVVDNVGISWAYGVEVAFYDSGEIIGSTVVVVIAPGESVAVTMNWTADEPLYPSQHTISVFVDPLDTVLESNESVAMGYAYVTVANLADISLTSSDIFTDPSTPVIGTECQLYAQVHNSGDTYAYDVYVNFYNGSIAIENLIGTDILSQISPGGNALASVMWTPEMVGPHVIYVTTNMSAEELDLSNNDAWATIAVYDYPDLAIIEMAFSPGDQIAGGETVTIYAQITNLMPAMVVDPVVAMYIDSLSGTPYTTTVVSGAVSDSTSSLLVTLSYDTLLVEQDTMVTVYLVVNPAHDPVEQGYDNNVISRPLTIIDTRPDLAVANLYVTYADSGITNQTFGRTVKVYAEVQNLGIDSASNFAITFGVLGPAGNWTIETIWIGLNGTVGAIPTDEIVTVNWFMNITTPGVYPLWVMLDSAGNYTEKSETNNYAAVDFEVLQLDISVDISVPKLEFKAGETILVTITVQYAGTTSPVPLLPGIVVTLQNSDGNVIEGTGAAVSYQTTEAGTISASLTIPILDGGTYTIVVSVLGGDYSSPEFQIGSVTAGGIPLIIWILVIIIIVASVVGFIIYTYVFGLGKMVECGECGAFIPAASKRCPKCGVEFEVGTMKCSECGAWVPAESTECPNCGVKFVGEEVNEEDYLEKMRKQYDEMVSKYRELAKTEMGKRYSEKKFEEWWRQQPTFISFDDWLAKEEEKAKEGPVPCPVCGTLNPKEATVCHKCGTVFGAGKETPPKTPPAAPPAAQQADAEVPPAPPAETPQAAPAAAPKMVIRRPIDRKVVPKKIIKTPMGEEKSENGNGGDDNQ